MNEPQLKRRTNLEKKIDMALEFQLVVLLKSRKELKHFCTRTSLALRITILCSLVLQKHIAMVDTIVKTIGAPENILQREFVDKISLVKYPPKEVFLYLNGEIGGHKGISDMRKKIYKEMEASGLIKIKKGHVYTKIVVQNQDTWQRVFDRVTGDVKNNTVDKDCEVLLLGLDYVDSLESLLLQCNEVTARMVVKQVDTIKTKIKEKKYTTEDQLLYKFLEILVV